MPTSALERLFFSAGLFAASRLLRLKRRHLFPATASSCAASLLISSGHRRIAVSQLVHSDAAPAVLIFHGIGETITDWVAVQELLYQSGISSLVFDYAGYGQSTGPIRLRCFHEDATTVLAYLRTLLPFGSPICYLGLSLGTGVALSLTTDAPPDRIVLCAPYTTFREAVSQAARLATLPALTSRLFPDVWNNREMISQTGIPTLLVHGEKDQLFPVAMSEDLRASCPSARLVRIPDLPHDCGLHAPQMDYWQPIIDFVRKGLVDDHLLRKQNSP